MIFLDFLFSAASGMLGTPPGAPQSYWRELFHKIIIFHDRCRRVGGRQGLATVKIHGKSSKIIENNGFQAKIMNFSDFSFSAASGMLLAPPGAPRGYSRGFFDKNNYFHERRCRVGGLQGLGTIKIYTTIGFGRGEREI